MEDRIQGAETLGCQKDYLPEVLKLPKMTVSERREPEAKSQATNRIGLGM